MWNFYLNIPIMVQTDKKGEKSKNECRIGRIKIKQKNIKILYRIFFLKKF